MDEVFRKTLIRLKQRVPNHEIFNLEPKEQQEFMSLVLRGQGYFVRTWMERGIKEISLPGLGTFLFNPLRTMVNKIKRELRDKLETFEINQVIKEAFVDYFADNPDPFRRSNPTIYRFNGFDPMIDKPVIGRVDGKVVYFVEGNDNFKYGTDTEHDIDEIN